MTTQKLSTWQKTYRQMLASVGPHAPMFHRCASMLAVAAIAQGVALACMVPLLIALLDTRDAAAAQGWLFLMTLLVLATLSLRWFALGFDYKGQMAEATHLLRTRLGEQLRNMPLARIQDKRSGEYNAMLLGNVDENLNYTLTVLNLMLTALLAPLAAALVLMVWDWRLGLALLLVFPVLVPLYRWRRPAFAKGLRKLEQAHAQTYGDVVEYVQGLPVLRASGQAGDKAVWLQESFGKLEALQVMGQRKGAGPNVMIASVFELGLLLVLAAGIHWLMVGTLAPAILVAVLILLARFAEPLTSFMQLVGVMEMIEAALERIERLLAEQPLPITTPVQKPESYDICFEETTFAYEQASGVAIRDFSARIPARSLTALVGPSGSGKTTLARLLQRQADPQHGRICIGGVDIRAMSAEVLNGLISVVFQDVYLFDDTVLANVRMARPDASDTEVLDAMRAACCLAFVESLPNGWHTRLGEIGGKLSGGERQRLSIARALLKQAPIVILDEPTAALDPQSELAVQQAIEALVRDRTVIVIAHRLSTIAGADQILVIEDGKLAAAGRHEALLQAGGRYAAMWQAQQALKSWHHSGSSPRGMVSAN